MSATEISSPPFRVRPFNPATSTRWPRVTSGFTCSIPSFSSPSDEAISCSVNPL